MVVVVGSEGDGEETSTHRSCTRALLRPRAAATAATARVWFDCTPPMETRVSEPLERASAARYLEGGVVSDFSLGGQKEGGRMAQCLLKLPHLVASEGKARVAVLALGVNLDLPAQGGGYTRQMLDGRRPEEEGFPRDAGEGLGEAEVEVGHLGFVFSFLLKGGMGVGVKLVEFASK